MVVKITLHIIFVSCMFGIVLPKLISSSSTELVALGLSIIFVVILLYANMIDKFLKNKKKEKSDEK